MSKDDPPNIPGFSHPIIVGDVEEEENEDDIGVQAPQEPEIEIGNFDAERDVPVGLARDLRNVAYERAQNIDKDVIDSLSTPGGPASDQLKLVEQMQIEEAVRMSLHGGQAGIESEELAALEDAQLAAALRESEELARTQTRSEEDDIQQAIAISRQESALGRMNWWEEEGPTLPTDHSQRNRPNAQTTNVARPDVRFKQTNKTVEDDAKSDSSGEGAAYGGGAGAADDGEDTVLVEVVQGDPVLVDIEKDFYRANLNYTRVLKIENDWLWSKFRNEVELMRAHSDSDFVLNMQALYHGTDAPVEVISEEGLDDRLSSRGHFGRGIYFSDDPRKCVQYSENGKDRYMLRCRVLLGDMKEYKDGEKDVKLKREPVKRVLNGQKIYYDSVMGKPRDYREYVVYERRRVLLEHVIFYTEKNQGNNQSQKPASSAIGSSTSRNIPSTSQHRPIQPVILDDAEDDEEEKQDESVPIQWRRHAGDEAGGESLGVGARRRVNIRTATCHVETESRQDSSNSAGTSETRQRRSSLDMDETGDERRGRRSSVDLQEETDHDQKRTRRRSVGSSEDEEEEHSGTGAGARPRRSSVDMDQEDPPARARKSSVDGDSDSDEVRVHPIDPDMEVIGAVMEDLVMTFLQFTSLEFTPQSREIAQRYIKKAPNYNIEEAIQLYFDEMDS